jgi:hypothetical protein
LPPRYPLKSKWYEKLAKEVFQLKKKNIFHNPDARNPSRKSEMNLIAFL